MVLCGCLGQAANVAQLGGVDICCLICMIIKAARTASRNDEECQVLASRAGTIDDLLRQLRSSEMVDHPETWKPLEGLNETLGRAYALVRSCQGRSCAYRFCMGFKLADRFDAVQKELDHYVGSLQLLFQSISHDDQTRRIKYITLTLEDQTRRIEDITHTLEDQTRTIEDQTRTLEEMKEMLNASTQQRMAETPTQTAHTILDSESSLDNPVREGTQFLCISFQVPEKLKTKSQKPTLFQHAEEVLVGSSASHSNHNTRVTVTGDLEKDKLVAEPSILKKGHLPGLTKFTSSQLADATNNFSLANQIGLGCFSIVYKGQLHAGLDVAVKRAAFGSESSFQFENEIKLTPKLRHANIVKLLGYCIQKREWILVFEYMPNGSLDSFIYGSEKTGVLLDWSTRRRIVEGIVQGAVYLHKLYGPCIIHGDLKPGNILLDSDMNPKICDFGISNALEPGVDEACTCTVMGSPGFVAPEYAERGCFSVKSDVYSFGATLLQIISGKRRPPLSDQSRDYGPLNSWAWDLWKEGRTMEILDPLLHGEPRKVEMMRWVQIALLCVQQHPEERPSMWDVLMMLSCESVLLQEPNQPAYYKADTANASSSSS